MRPTVSRRFATLATPEAAYAFLADFTSTERWDPGTRRCVLLDGDGGVGTRYLNTSVFAGREVQVTYETQAAEAPTRLHFVGTNETFTGHDVFGFRADPGGGPGCEVSYTAEFSFSGSARYAAPLIAAYLPFLATKTIAQLKGCLDSLAVTQ